jgi:hypothetical protein
MCQDIKNIWIFQDFDDKNETRSRFDYIFENFCEYSFLNPFWSAKAPM